MRKLFGNGLFLLFFSTEMDARVLVSMTFQIKAKAFNTIWALAFQSEFGSFCNVFIQYFLATENLFDVYHFGIMKSKM